jgi:hypothetical protein
MDIDLTSPITYVIPSLAIILGILGIKLPYKYNPFRIKLTYSENESAQIVPKIIGWILVSIGSLSLLGLIALYYLLVSLER